MGFNDWHYWQTTGVHCKDEDMKKCGLATVETCITRPTAPIHKDFRVYNHGAILHTQHKYGITMLHILNVYINPKMTMNQIRNVFRQLHWVVSQAKHTDAPNYFIIGGDFNKKGIVLAKSFARSYKLNQLIEDHVATRGDV